MYFSHFFVKIEFEKETEAKAEDEENENDAIKQEHIFEKSHLPNVISKFCVPSLLKILTLCFVNYFYKMHSDSIKINLYHWNRWGKFGIVTECKEKRKTARQYRNGMRKNV